MTDDARTSLQAPQDLQYALGELWAASHDLGEAYAFIGRHSTYSQELCSVLAYLIEVDGVHPGQREEVAAWTSRIHRYLETEGFRIALNAQRASQAGTTHSASAGPASGTPPTAPGSSPPPASQLLMPVLLDASQQEPMDVAEALGLPVGFLADISHNGRVVPMPARQEIARRAAGKWGVKVGRVVAAFDAEPEQRMAASRQSEYSGNQVTFDSILSRSGMPDALVAYWRKLAGLQP